MPQTIVNVEDFGPAGNGTADDQGALQSAFDAAAGGVLLFPDASKVYALDGLGLTIHDHTRVINAGAELRLRLRGGGHVSSKAPAIEAAAGFRADLLRIRADGGTQVNRVLSLNSDTSIERIEIWADVQQANTLAHTGDSRSGALQIRGSRTRLGYVSVNDFDRPVFANGVDHVTVQRIEVNRYVTAVHLRECGYFELGSGAIASASSSNVGNRDDHDTVAGMNGLLIEDCHDLVISDLIVHDSIEHGVRIGGRGPTRRCTFNNIQVRGAGWCGLKVQPRQVDGGSAAQIQINGLMVLDCAPPLVDGEPEAKRFQLPGAVNRSGVRLQDCSNVVVNGLQVGRDSRALYSAYHGIYIVGCTDVTVNGPHIADTYNAGIALSDGSDRNGAGPSAAVNQIYIRDPVVTFLAPEAHAGLKVHGIWLHSPAQYVRNIVITGIYVRGHTGYGVWLTPPPTTTGVRWPLIVQGWVKAEGQGVFHATAQDVDIHISITSV